MGTGLSTRGCLPWLFCTAQGGTCLFMGDQEDLLSEAAEIAQEAIGCTPLFGAPSPLEDGFSRDGFAELDLGARCSSALLQLPPSSSTAVNVMCMCCGLPGWQCAASLQ